MRLVLFILLATPSVATADCIYTGAKRSYLECTYAEAVAATAQATATAADVLGLDTRLGAAEGSISFLDAAVLSLSDRVSGRSRTLSRSIRRDPGSFDRFDGTEVAAMIIDVGRGSHAG